MPKLKKFVIPSLVAAGLVPFSVSSAGQNTGKNDADSPLDDSKSVVRDIGNSHEFTLAQHRSHVSHQSHQSHRSYSGTITPIDQEAGTTLANLENRNLESTPPTSVLPSSPVVASKKVKILPGNSEKFRQIVLKVQVALATKGYDVGALNGEAHARTTAAIFEYQRTSGLEASGKLTDEFLSSLGIVAQ